MTPVQSISFQGAAMHKTVADLKHDPLDSNDLRAWESLAARLERERDEALACREHWKREAELGADRVGPCHDRAAFEKWYADEEAKYGTTAPARRQ
jgi:hypothetical protein